MTVGKGVKPWRGYKQRLTADLDRWIADGHVPAESREAILATIPDARRLDAATALAWVGAILAGVAVIAFIAANWDGLPRLARFLLIVGLFAASAGAAAWLHRAGRPRVADGVLTFAALVFGAAIGLTGQIFDIAGDPRGALYASGVVAAALSLAAGATGPGVAAILFIGLADFAFPGRGLDVSWLIVAAPAAGLLAVRWRSVPLAHAAALGLIAAMGWLAWRWHADNAGLLGFSAAFAALALGGRRLRARGLAAGAVAYGWFAWATVYAFVAAGYLGGHDWGVPHRLAWLMIAGGLVALGRHDRHALVTTAGVLGLIGAMAAVLMDLGLGLMTAAGLFLAAAVIAGLAGLALRRRPA